VKKPLLRPIITLSSLGLAISCFATALFGQTVPKSQLPTYRVTSAPVGNHPIGITFDGDNITNIWVANFDSNEVSKLRASDGALLGTFSTGEGPYAILVNGTRIWIAGAGSVTELRAQDGSQVGIYSISDAEPYLRSIVSDGHNIWVGQYSYPGSVTPGQGITAINARKGTVLGSVKVPKGPDGLAFDGTNIWVSDANAGTVSIVDPVTKVDLQDIGVGNYPAGILFDGVNIWVANQASNTVSRISAE
jgi:YVTN family beta-propeller protein